jgi:hypothetical protein
LIGALLELRLVIEEDEVEFCQRLRDELVVDSPPDHRREPLVERLGLGNLLQRYIGCDRIGADHEDDRIRASDQRLDPLPPFLEGVDVCSVDEGLEAARL